MALLSMLLRARWRRAWAASLAVCLLIALIGGFVLASAASARRVDGAYRDLVDEIGAPDVSVIPCEQAVDGTGCISSPDEPEPVLEALKDVAVVEQARVVEAVIPYLVDATGRPLQATSADPRGCYDGDRKVAMVGLGRGGATDQALPFRFIGDLPEPGSTGVLLARATAERAGVGIGDTVRLAGWCNDGGEAIRLRPIDLTVTGLSTGPLDVEPPGTGTAREPAHVDPGVFDALLGAGAEPALNVMIWLDPAASPENIAEGLASYEIVVDFRERVRLFDDALETDARLLWLLAGIGAVGGLLVLAPVIARNLRETGSDTTILAALGVRRPQIALEAMAHAASLGVIGALGAATLAVPFSALMPRGLAAAISPDRQMWFDPSVTVAGIGLVVLAVVMMGAVPAWRIGRPERSDSARVSARDGGVVGALGLGPAALTGVLAAVGSPAGPRRASPWPGLVSLMVVMAAGVASLTYLAGLRNLENSPSLVGWNWDAYVGFDSESGSAEDVSSMLAEIDELDAVQQVTAGTFFPPTFLVVADTEIFVWPWSFATGPDAITPTILNGRAPEGPDEVAVDPTLARQSGLGVGDTVSFGRRTASTQLATDLEDETSGEVRIPVPDEGLVVGTYEISGIAVIPGERAQPLAHAAFTLEGLAALAEPDAEEVAAALGLLPDDLASDLRSGAEGRLSNLEIDDRGVYLRFSGDVQSSADAVGVIEGVGRENVFAPAPEEVLTLFVGLNLTRGDRVPVALALTFAAAFVALTTYLLFATVRSRRFELAVMSALGMAAGGIRRSVAAQATATALVSSVVAIPVGVAVGRWAWMAYARDLDVLPVAVIPWSALALVAVAAIATANLAALVGLWSSARSSPGQDLRSE